MGLPLLTGKAGFCNKIKLIEKVESSLGIQCQRYAGQDQKYLHF